MFDGAGREEEAKKLTSRRYAGQLDFEGYCRMGPGWLWWWWWGGGWPWGGGREDPLEPLGKQQRLRIMLSW